MASDALAEAGVKEGSLCKTAWWLIYLGEDRQTDRRGRLAARIMWNPRTRSRLIGWNTSGFQYRLRTEGLANYRTIKVFLGQGLGCAWEWLAGCKHTACSLTSHRNTTRPELLCSFIALHCIYFRYAITVVSLSEDGLSCCSPPTSHDADCKHCILRDQNTRCWAETIAFPDHWRQRTGKCANSHLQCFQISLKAHEKESSQ
jgi:hypothetical protein